MNPEFQRYVWLDLPTHRIIAMPAVLMLVFAAAWLGGGLPALAPASQVTLALLVIVWGSRLAADSVLSEVAARTWDNQRMSAIGPWEMAWGKLLGSTVYVWYGALWCVAAFVLADTGLPVDVIRLILAGLQAQALALLLSLVLLRRGAENLHFNVTIAQVLAILMVLPFQTLISVDHRGFVSWYGFAFAQPVFLVVTQMVFIAWTILGVYRIMLSELQFPAGQAIWTSFVIFMSLFIAGFDGLLILNADRPLPGIMAARFFVAFCIAVALTYLGAFIEPKGLVRLRRWVHFAQIGRVDRVIEMIPLWLISAVVAIILGLATLLTIFLGTVDWNEPLWAIGPFLLAIVLFATRDIAMLYYLVLQEHPGRAHLTTVVYLLVLYFIAPAGLSTAGLDQLAPIFVPSQIGPPGLVVLPVLAQAVVALILALRRWASVRATDMDRVGMQ